MQATITTDRLQLNLLKQSDYLFVKELVNTDGWLQFIGNRNVSNDEQAIAYINKIMNTPNLYYWICSVQENNIPVGIISFLKRDYLEHYDIGFALLPKYSKQGYAYEAANAVLNIMQQNAQHQTVLATTLPHNTTSINLLTKLNFSYLKTIDKDYELLKIYINTKQ